MLNPSAINPLGDLATSMSDFVAHTQAMLPFLGRLAAGLAALVFLNQCLGGRLLFLGLIPRRWYGLPGIIVSPFLHANWNHLFFNLIPLLVLSDFILVQGVHVYMQVTACIILLSGSLLWCFGQSAIHVGASGVITGYWGWLVTNIFTQGSGLGIALGLVSVYYFATIFLGIFPEKKGVSWDGHLCGLLAGVAVSYFLPIS